LTRDAGRLYGTIGVTAETWDYRNVLARDGSTIDEDERDTQMYSTTLRAGYRFSPGYEIQVKVRGLRQLNRGNAVLDRDAFGYDVLAGLSIETSPLLRWRLLGGYGVRDYDQVNLPTAASSLLEAEVQWLPTPLITVFGTLKREMTDSAIAVGTGRLDTAVIGKVQYEMWRNLIFTFDAELRDSDYFGTTRHDRLYGGRAGLEYMLTPNWVLSAGYEHQRLSSTDEGAHVTRNKFMVGAKLRF
jgi:hypothetical protein